MEPESDWLGTAIQVILHGGRKGSAYREKNTPHGVRFTFIKLSTATYLNVLICNLGSLDLKKKNRSVHINFKIYPTAHAVLQL